MRSVCGLYPSGLLLKDHVLKIPCISVACLASSFAYTAGLLLKAPLSNTLKVALCSFEPPVSMGGTSFPQAQYTLRFCMHSISYFP